MQNPIAVANYFVSRSFEEGNLLDLMKVVKLTYLSHGWHLALKNEPLLNEAVQAWQYGPVVSSVYRAFKSYRDSCITAMAQGSLSSTPYPTDEGVVQFLSSVWDAYKGFTGLQLSTLTHQEGTAWHETWHQDGAKHSRGMVIPNERIMRHFRELAAKRQSGH